VGTSCHMCGSMMMSLVACRSYLIAPGVALVGGLALSESVLTRRGATLSTHCSWQVGDQVMSWFIQSNWTS